MAIEVDGKIYRNLPEQVEENANNIEDIKARISELSTVMVYKGSVATYADLPTEDNKVGDFYNVLDTGDNYAWDGEGWDQIATSVDLSELAKLNESNTFTDENTFQRDVIVEGDLVFAENVTYSINDLVSNEFTVYQLTISSEYDTYTSVITQNENGSAYWSLANVDHLVVGGGRVASVHLRPLTDNTYDLGTSSLGWKDLYLTGKIYGGGNEKINLSGSGISLTGELYTNLIRPRSNGVSDIGSSIMHYKDLYMNGQIIGASNVLNIINASDIVSNTLTQAQYDLITNGKPTIILGTFLTKVNPILFAGNDDGSGNIFGLYIGQSSSTGSRADFSQYKIIISSKAISLLGTTQQIDYTGKLNAQLGNVNGKQLPAYPSDTGTFVLKCVNGTLTWVQE